MASVKLSKLLKKAESSGIGLGVLVNSLRQPVGILDKDGSLLIGKDGNPEDERRPILLEDQVAGWVVGSPGSPWVKNLATWLEFLLAQEAENKALAEEVLDKYRELNLLYRLSEKLVSSPQAEAIAQVALQEACPLIRAEAGLFVLQTAGQAELRTIARCGGVLADDITLAPDSIVTRVLASGNGEIANEQPAGMLFQDGGEGNLPVLCAPLKTERGILGAFLVIGAPDRQFTAGDLKLVSVIAMQAAPAIEIVNLHQLELEKERLDRDLETAQQVQTGLLPQSMPDIPGSQVAAYWKPARQVGGDFYDFFQLPDGRWGLVVGDVSDKGMSAALVMAATRTTLRAVLTRLDNPAQVTPGELLGRVNDVLSPDMPMNMFVTCLLVLLDPVSGRLQLANAGHNPPFLRTRQGVEELRAGGLPLGLPAFLVPGAAYEEKDWQVEPGDTLLMYSDGLVEAHDPGGDMYGYPRLRQYMHEAAGPQAVHGEKFIDTLVCSLHEFTGPDWEQEDDVTLVVLEYGQE